MRRPHDPYTPWARVKPAVVFRPHSTCAMLPCSVESIWHRMCSICATVVAEPGEVRAPYRAGLMDPMQLPGGIHGWMQDRVLELVTLQRDPQRPQHSVFIRHLRIWTTSLVVGAHHAVRLEVPKQLALRAQWRAQCPIVTGAMNPAMIPLAQFSNPPSLGMLGSFSNVSQQLGFTFQPSAVGNQPCAAPPMPGPSTAPVTAASMLNSLDQSAMPTATPQVHNAFEMLGKAPVTPRRLVTTMKRSWWRPWLRLWVEIAKRYQVGMAVLRPCVPGWGKLFLWEFDNHVPKSHWNFCRRLPRSQHLAKLRRRLTIDIPTLTWVAGYGAILSAILSK